MIGSINWQPESRNIGPTPSHKNKIKSLFSNFIDLKNLLVYLSSRFRLILIGLRFASSNKKLRSSLKNKRSPAGWLSRLRLQDFSQPILKKYCPCSGRTCDFLIFRLFYLLSSAKPSVSTLKEVHDLNVKCFGGTIKEFSWKCRLWELVSVGQWKIKNCNESLKNMFYVSNFLPDHEGNNVWLDTICDLVEQICNR